MNIRERIQGVLESTPTPAAAAIEVCVELEKIIDLAGNGWWDDDPVMVQRLGLDIDESDDFDPIEDDESEDEF